MIMTVGAAILPVDGFTGFPITDGSAAVRAEAGRKGIRKKDGYYIFWDNGEPFLRLFAGGGIYQPEQRELSLEKLRKQPLPAYALYLYPSEYYPFPPGIGWERAEGTGMDTGTDGMVPWNVSKNALCLAGDGSPGCRSISLRADAGVILEDRTLYIRRSGQDALKCLKLGGQLDQRAGEYALETPLSESCRLHETELYFAYKGKASGDGTFLVPYFIDRR